MNKIYQQIVERIVESQQGLLGPVALERARAVDGVLVTGVTASLMATEGEEKSVINALVKEYEGLFGDVALNQCRDAVKSLLHDMEESDIPELLR